MEPKAPARGVRADEGVGGRLVVKRGAVQDIEFRSRAQRTIAPGTGPAASPQKPKRRCRFCGKPMLFLLAPLILVFAFVLRNQNTNAPNDRGAVAGYTVSLAASAVGSDARVVVTVRPGGRLETFVLREKPAPAGTPVAAAIYTASTEGGPDMVYGVTPGPGDPDAVFVTRVRASSPGESVRAEVSILGKTVSLTAPVVP